MAALIAVSDHLLSDNTFGSSCPKYSDPDNVPTTAAGEVELESSGQRSSQDFTHRQISGWTQIDTFEGIDPQKIDQIQWQDAEIPKELELIQAGTPVEICRIIKASLDNHRGIKASPVDRGASERRDSGNDMQVVDLELDPSAAHDSTSQPRSTRSTSGASDSSAGSSSKASETSTSRFSVSTPSSVDSGTECNSQTLSEKRTPGQPKVTIGPLGWIITYEDGEKPKSWWRRHKEPKKPKQTHNQTKPIPRGHREDGECASCLEDMSIKKLVDLTCQHKYCAPCFSQLVSTAMQNENFFPPKCCLQTIPTKLIQPHVPTDVKDLFKLKAKEYAVPAGERWYCPSPSCSKWMDRGKLSSSSPDSFKCPYCKFKICRICHAAAHDDDEDCPQDFGLDATLEAAEREGWRRCYRCRAMVELTVGCRHITCKCKAEFCYTCGAIWRTCNCTEVDEERRRQRTREQRHAQDTAARTEAADIAAAIRAVEEQERREAEEAERLERLRQEAEAARLAREAEVVRQREEERLTAINHKFVDLQGVLENLHYTQQKSMGKRHEAEMKRIKENMVSSQLAFDAKWALERAWMKRTNHDVIERLSVEHQTAIKEMDTRHEEEEDDIFLALRVHLRNKSNRSAREKAMVEKMKNSQLAERQSLLTRQTATMEKILRREKLKIAELEAVLLQERETEKDRDIKIAELVVRQVFADRMWFDTLVDERRSMLDEDERRLVRTRADGAEYGTWDLQSQVA